MQCSRGFGTPRLHHCGNGGRLYRAVADSVYSTRSGSVAAFNYRAVSRDKVMRRHRSGQAATEFALLYSAAILPLTFMIVFVSQMLWTWHSVVDFTRTVAQFAATHCWQADNSGSNVIQWATTHVPPIIDRDQFQSNAAGITVAYFAQNADGSQTPFTGDCSGGPTCMPDAVSVSVTSYQYNRFSSFFGLGNVLMPPFTTV